MSGIQVTKCTVAEIILKNTWQELEWHVDILRATKALKFIEVNDLIKNFNSAYNMWKQTYVELQ